MKTGRFLKVLLLLFTLCVPGTTHAANSEAVVTSTTLPMHAEKTRDSAVVRILQGGETVTVESEVGGSDGSWCFVTLKGTMVMGYVPCDGLTLKSKASLWDRLLDKINDNANDNANDNTTERRSSQNSNVRVLLYMTEW